MFTGAVRATQVASFLRAALVVWAPGVEMWLSVNFNELSWTICLLSNSNKELYKFLVLGLDIPHFDFNI